MRFALIKGALVLVLCLVALAAPKPSPSLRSFEGTLSTILDQNLRLAWTVTGDTVEFVLTLQRSAWLGFGINPESGMIDGDVYVLEWPNGQPEATDRFALQFDLPPEDATIGGTNDILSWRASQNFNVTTFVFKRKLVTGDPRDQDVVIGGPVNIIWAYGEPGTNAFGYHGPNKGSACFDLSTGVPCGVQLDQIKLPPGFSIELWASVPNARQMALSDDLQTLFVGSWIGNVYALDVNQPSVVISVAQGLVMPNGVAFRNGALYIAEQHQITRYDNVLSTLPKLPAGTVIREFAEPPSPQHAWKHIQIGPDGKVYSSVNSPCNTCWDDDPYGGLFRMDTNGSNIEIIARGIRDTQGFDFDPQSGNVWFTDNGRDEWGNDRPPDELNYVAIMPSHFGFPFCYGTDLADEDWNMDGNCTRYVAPVQNLAAHTAALGVKFYRGGMFPPEYRTNTLFIAEHGSWNRQPPFGYRVTMVKITPDRKAVSYTAFAEGWLNGRFVSGRPVDMVFLKDGSMLLSDDSNGVIYRIYYGA